MHCDSVALSAACPRMLASVGPGSGDQFVVASGAGGTKRVAGKLPVRRTGLLGASRAPPGGEPGTRTRAIQPKHRQQQASRVRPRRPQSPGLVPWKPGGDPRHRHAVQDAAPVSRDEGRVSSRVAKPAGPAPTYLLPGSDRLPLADCKHSDGPAPSSFDSHARLRGTSPHVGVEPAALGRHFRFSC